MAVDWSVSIDCLISPRPADRVSSSLHSLSSLSEISVSKLLVDSDIGEGSLSVNGLQRISRSLCSLLMFWVIVVSDRSCDCRDCVMSVDSVSASRSVSFLISTSRPLSEFSWSKTCLR